jgi:chaperone modulatory protein CbpM
MITIETLIVTIDGLTRADIEHWIAEDWLRPTASQGAWNFQDIDVARLHLILDLHREFHLDDNAIPMVLNLLDQLYDARRHLRRLSHAISQTPADARETILRVLDGR